MDSIIKLNEDLQSAVGEEYQNRKWVPGSGITTAPVVLVGEAPGAKEELEGLPFVGAAGKHLTNFLGHAKLTRKQLYITNVVKIRPFRLSPKTNKAVNRPPNSDELLFFTPFLMRELQIIKPKLVVTLGNVPLRALTGNKKAVIGRLHGRLLRHGFLLFPLYHPASVIYNSSLKEVYLKDLEVLSELVREGL